MRPFILSSAPGGRPSGRVQPGRNGRRPNPFNEAKPKPSLHRERIEWYQMVEGSCAYYLKELAEYQKRIDQLGATNSSDIPKRVRRGRSYPNWWIRAAESRGERLRKEENYWQGLDGFRTERTALVKRIVDLEEEVKASHAQFSTGGVWDKDANSPLVHEYYLVSTEFSWIQTDIQNMIRTATPATTAAPPRSATKTNVPSFDEYEERMRRKRNWIYNVMCWCRILGPYNVPFEIGEKWWRRFDWVAVITLLLLPFLPTLLAYPYTYDRLACLMVIGYYTWLLMHYSFIRFPGICTVLWPAFYLAPFLTFRAFFSVAVSHAIFTLALTSLTTHAEEYTRR